MKSQYLTFAFFLLLLSSCKNNQEATSVNSNPSTTESPEVPTGLDSITSDQSIETPVIVENNKIPETNQPAPSTKIKTNTDIISLKKGPDNASTTPEVTTPAIKVEKEPDTKAVQNKPVTLPSQPVALPAPPKKENNDPPSHAAFDKILSQYVSTDGKVNYTGLKSAKASLKAYTDLLAKNPVQEAWPRSEKLAYWINAYNAFTLSLIVDNYPLSSITKLDSGKPWDVKRITLGDKKYSLNDIENNIIRPQFKDARIHFAVNCAAKSCPPLLNRAWTAANLNSYFEQQAKKFINDTRFNIIKSNEVKISRIFEWYASDFGSIITFLNKYSTTKINEKAKISYLEYNWSLNE